MYNSRKNYADCSAIFVIARNVYDTLRKKILRSKEMYLIDSISLYQTIRYPIKLNIF